MNLTPVQVCFVVDSVADAVRFAEQAFGWGPFHQFTANVDNARYRDWQGYRRVDVALGMAGAVQVELVHVHEGRDAIASYQQQYGSGPQHLGILCQDRDQAIDWVQSAGAMLDDKNEFPGIRFAFMDVPTGPAMWELLQPVAAQDSVVDQADAQAANAASALQISLDRATVVTGDMQQALACYGPCFRWSAPAPEWQTLQYGDQSVRLRRYLGHTGVMTLELIEAPCDGETPYSAQRRRGDHGLAHAGGTGQLDGLTPVFTGRWLETDEHIALYDWAGGQASLQLRQPA